MNPFSHILGLGVNAGVGYLSYYLFKHKHPVLGTLCAFASLGGAAFNVYNLAQPQPPTQYAFFPRPL